MTAIEDALPAMQGLASRIWSPASRHHPGQLAWSAAYALPEELDHGPVALFHAGAELVGWAWAEADDWLELCVDPAHPAVAREAVAWFLGTCVNGPVRAMTLETEDHLLGALSRAGFVPEEGPWFTHHHLDLGGLGPVPDVRGYALRPVTVDEAEERSACHRVAWSPPGSTSKVSAAAYRRLMRTPPYRAGLDWVAVDGAGAMVASCLVWLDAHTGVALVEPVGCAPGHRGRGLAGAVSLAALHAARELGATVGLVCPRGDDGYPVPQRVYRSIGFVPGPRTVTMVRMPGPQPL